MLSVSVCLDFISGFRVGLDVQSHAWPVVHKHIHHLWQDEVHDACVASTIEVLELRVFRQGVLLIRIPIVMKAVITLGLRLCSLPTCPDFSTPQ